MPGYRLFRPENYSALRFQEGYHRDNWLLAAIWAAFFGHEGVLYKMGTAFDFCWVAHACIVGIWCRLLKNTRVGFVRRRVSLKDLSCLW